MAVIKVEEASDVVLDCMVAKCEGKGVEFECPSAPWLTVDGIADQPLHSYTPSTDWSQGGPIIDRERIGVYPSQRDEYAGLWAAQPDHTKQFNFPHIYGATPLIAAMRCYVASKLGDEVDVPDELIGA